MTKSLAIAWMILLILSPDTSARRRAVRVQSPLVAISTIEPRSGPIAGGTSVTIRGSGFLPNDLRVFFGDQAATSLTYVAADELRAIVPPHANGYVAVRVVNQGRSASTEFLYTPPSLDSIAVGAITTVAGVGLYLAEGGSARAAPFNLATADITVDADGSVFVIEPDRLVVRKIAPDGTCTRFAGRGINLTPTEAAANDIGDGRLATEAAANGRGITVGPDGNVYLSAVFFHRIRRIDRQTGIITTVAGSGPITYHGAFAGDGGPATQARLDQPNQVAFDGSGNMYILDAVNYRIRRVAPDGIINTIAGNGTRGFSGDGGPATVASFNIGPDGDGGALKIDRDGNVLFTDVENRRIRRIDTRTGIITTVVGGGSRDDEGAPASETSALGVAGIAVAADGTTYYSEASRIRRIGPDGRVTTLFGELTPGFSDDGVRSGRLAAVGRMEIDAPRNRLLFCELLVNRIRSIDLTTGTLSTIAGNGPATLGENGPAIAAELEISAFNTQPLAVTADDGLLIGGYTRLRKLERNGVLRVVAGGGLSPAGQPPPQRPAVGTPIDTFGIAVAANGDIYVAGPFEVGRITADGMYRRIAGGAYGYSGDNGPASAATLDNPANIALDAAGSLFIADSFNHCIRRIDAQSGIITTFAGKSPPHPPNVFVSTPSSGDGGRAVDAQLGGPNYLAIDAAGNVYVDDIRGVRMIDRNGIIDTVLGGGFGGLLASDSAGRVYVYNAYGGSSGQIVRIDGKNNATVVGATANRPGFSGDGGPAAQAETRNINGMAIDRFGNVYLMDWENRRVRAIRSIANIVRYAVPAGGGFAASTQGGSSSISVGYGRLQPASGSTAPSALAIFSFRQGNVLVSEAAVPASSLVSVGRTYAEVGAGVNTGLAIANPNNQAVTLTFYFTDRTGQNFGQGTTTIAANGQIAKFLNEAPFNGGDSLSDTTFTFTSSLPVVAIALRGFTNERSEFLLTTLPVADLSVAAGTESILFPHFAHGAGWTTQILLINTSDQAMAGTVQFYSAGTSTSAGQIISGASVDYDIPRRSSVKVGTSGVASTLSTGSIRVVPRGASRTPTGVAVFSFRNAGVTVSEAGVPSLGVSNAFRLYAESSGTPGQVGSIQTGVAVANPSTSPANVTFELTRLNGASTGLTGSAIVPGNGQVAMFLGQIQGFAALASPFQGVLRVSTASSAGISVVGLRARYNERTDFLITTTQPNDENRAASTSEQFFPHLADGGGYTTQFILFNGSTDQASSGSLRFFTQSGQSLSLTVR